MQDRKKRHARTPIWFGGDKSVSMSNAGGVEGRSQGAFRNRIAQEPFYGRAERPN
jgi:hypothetical protein